MGDNQNSAFGFPKTTQITQVRSDHQSLLVRLPRTFFTPNQSHRFVYHGGLRFQVYCNPGKDEEHSTVCTGVLRYHPPQTLRQLDDLIAILTSFARRDREVIRQIRNIYTSQIQRLAGQAQSNPVSGPVRFPSEGSTTENFPQQRTVRDRCMNNFHPYQRGGYPRYFNNHQYSRPNEDINTSKNVSFRPRINRNNRGSNQRPNLEPTFNRGSCMFQPSGSRTNVQPMSSTLHQVGNNSWYPNNFDYQQGTFPSSFPHTVTSNSLGNNNWSLQPNVARNWNPSAYHASVTNPFSRERPSPASGSHTHVNQQMSAPQNSQTMPSSIAHGTQQSAFRNPGQMRVQIPNQQFSNQNPNIPNGMSSYMNQHKFNNSFVFQNQNTSQHAQLAVSGNMQYTSPTVTQRVVNQAQTDNLNHYPAPPPTPFQNQNTSQHAQLAVSGNMQYTSPTVAQRVATQAQTDNLNHYPLPPPTPFQNQNTSQHAQLAVSGNMQYTSPTVAQRVVNQAQTDNLNHYPAPPPTPFQNQNTSQHAQLAVSGNMQYTSSTVAQRVATQAQTDNLNHYPAPPPTPFQNQNTSQHAQLAVSGNMQYTSPTVTQRVATQAQTDNLNHYPAPPPTPFQNSFFVGSNQHCTPAILNNQPSTNSFSQQTDYRPDQFNFTQPHLNQNSQRNVTQFPNNGPIGEISRYNSQEITVPPTDTNNVSSTVTSNHQEYEGLQTASTQQIQNPEMFRPNHAYESNINASVLKSCNQNSQVQSINSQVTQTCRPNLIYLTTTENSENVDCSANVTSSDYYKSNPVNSHEVTAPVNFLSETEMASTSGAIKVPHTNSAFSRVSTTNSQVKNGVSKMPTTGVKSVTQTRQNVEVKQNPYNTDLVKTEPIDYEIQNSEMFRPNHAYENNINASVLEPCNQNSLVQSINSEVTQNSNLIAVMTQENSEIVDSSANVPSSGDYNSNPVNTHQIKLEPVTHQIKLEPVNYLSETEMASTSGAIKVPHTNSAFSRVSTTNPQVKNGVSKMPTTGVKSVTQTCQNVEVKQELNTENLFPNIPFNHDLVKTEPIDYETYEQSENNQASRDDDNLQSDAPTSPGIDEADERSLPGGVEIDDEILDILNNNRIDDISPLFSPMGSSDSSQGLVINEEDLNLD